MNELKNDSHNSRRLAPHAIVEFINITGFQPERQIKCRCGWKSERHYSRKRVEEQYREHKQEAK